MSRKRFRYEDSLVVSLSQPIASRVLDLIFNSSSKLKLNETFRTLLTSSAGLEHAKSLLTQYKRGEIRHMTPELWDAKKIVDSTLHPGTFTK